MRAAQDPEVGIGLRQIAVGKEEPWATATK